MKVLLVNPPGFNGIPVILEERCEITERYSVVPPYCLLQVASLLKDRGHEISIIDANVLDLDYDNLIFRFTPTTFDHDMMLTKVSKELCPAAKTIGICWTMRTLPEEVLENASKRITVEQAEKSIRMAKDIGIKTYSSFMFGLPGENWETVNKKDEACPLNASK